MRFLFKTIYGDYIQLPPEEKRWMRHDVEKNDLGFCVRENK